VKIIRKTLTKGEMFMKKSFVFIAALTVFSLVVIGHPILSGGETVGSPMQPMDGMVYIPAGNFPMGSDNGFGNGRPVHTVYLDAFYIDKYEVTNAQFAQFLTDGNDPYYYDLMKITKDGDAYTAQPGYENHPAVWVDWFTAKAYCEWAGKRLPTEAEWEKAARGTDGRTYPWGEEIDGRMANYHLSGDPYDVRAPSDETTPVGYYNGINSGTVDSPSPYGVYDMAGNAWEWVGDWYSETYYSHSPSSNPQGPSSGAGRVLKGGAWNFYPYYVQSALRYYFYPYSKFFLIGFRCARS
jgi:formylglycine-generating enzyme required for sulfatase activity